MFRQAKPTVLSRVKLLIANKTFLMGPLGYGRETKASAWRQEQVCADEKNHGWTGCVSLGPILNVYLGSGQNQVCPGVSRTRSGIAQVFHVWEGPVTSGSTQRIPIYFCSATCV